MHRNPHVSSVEKYPRRRRVRDLTPIRSATIALARRPGCHLPPQFRFPERPPVAPQPLTPIAHNHAVARHLPCHDRHATAQVRRPVFQCRSRRRRTAIGARGLRRDLQKSDIPPAAARCPRVPTAFGLGQHRQKPCPECPPVRQLCRFIARTPGLDIARYLGCQNAVIACHRRQCGYGPTRRFGPRIPAHRRAISRKKAILDPVYRGADRASCQK